MRGGEECLSWRWREMLSGQREGGKWRLFNGNSGWMKLDLWWRKKESFLWVAICD